MSDDSVTNKLGRPPWYSFAALMAAAFAFLGLNPPKQETTIDAKNKDTSLSSPMPNGLVSFPQRIWDDPFEQLVKAQELLGNADRSKPRPETPASKAADGIPQSGKHSEFDPNGRLDALQQILLERIFDNSKFDSPPSNSEKEAPRLLVVLNLVPGQFTKNDVQSRLSSRHVQEIAFSLFGFRPMLPDRLSFVRLAEIETHFSLAHHVHSSPAVPIKLYENPVTKQFILNIWFDQEMLGFRPWRCVQTIFKSLCGDNSNSSAVHSKWIRTHLMHRASLAVFGPNTSDIMKAMKPSFMNENREVFLRQNDSSVFGEEDTVKDFELLLGWKSVHWQVNQCSVPLESQWPSLFKNSRTTEDTSKSKEISFSSLPLKLHVSLPDDKELIAVLANELETRLGNFSDSSRQILLFVEQDRAYGRFLGDELKKQLSQKKAPFRLATVPYLRELGAKVASSQSSDLEAPQSTVNDYFQRTLDSLGNTNSEFRKPAAIGILGGSWQDKVALIREIRTRFPQSLCFTNDFDARFADSRLLPVTRNLLIASHGDPMPRVKTSQGDIASISFRNEYQAADLVGYANLFEKVFHFREKDREIAGGKKESKSSPTIEPECRTEARVFEVTNSGFKSMPLRSEEDSIANPARPLLSPLLGVFAVALLLGFPAVHKFVQDRLEQFRKQEKQNRWIRYSQEHWGGPTRAIFSNVSSSTAFLFTALLCLVPTATLLECSAASIVHWTTGISIVPSILLLALTIPFTFRPTLKSEQHKDGREDRLHEFELQVQRLKDVIEKPATSADTLPQTSVKVSLKQRHSLGVAFAVAVLITGFFTWYWTSDLWILQIGLLGVIAFSLEIRRTMAKAIYTTLLVGVTIGWARYIANDYEIVPARDAWLRLVGSTCFVVAYWWLLVGLIKLTYYQRRLRTQIRECGQRMEQLQEEKTSITVEIARELDTTVVETGRVSRSISQDLGLLAGIGLVVCFARMPLLDAWGMSYATWLTIILPMAIPFVFAIILRRRAWRFRDNALQYMIRAKREASSDDLRKLEIEEINERQSLIKGYEAGVFAPIDRDPLVSAGLALLLALFSGPNSEIIRRIVSSVVL